MGFRKVYDVLPGKYDISWFLSFAFILLNEYLDRLIIDQFVYLWD